MEEVCIQRAERRWKVHVDRGIDCSIGVTTKSPMQRAFALPAARAEWMYVCGRGGVSVNVGTFMCSCHGAGTHTECVGHIVPPRGDGDVITLDECGVPLRAFTPAVLLSVDPRNLRASGERYNEFTDATSASSTSMMSGDVVAMDAFKDDRVVTKAALIEALDGMYQCNKESTTEFVNAMGGGAALCIRVLPNSDAKRRMDWSGAGAAYVTSDAAEWIVASGFHHLLIDLPSVDREDDGGKLVAHKTLLRCDETSTSGPTPHTITELCFFPDDSAPDGMYMLNLHVPNVDMDAAPSRPILYPIEDCSC